jgi:hypothetical protein
VDKNFNTDFYVTAATVIPVLYVAIAAQLPFVNRATKWLASYSWKNASEEGSKALRVMARMATPVILIAASAVLVISVTAEIYSALALFSESDTHTIRLYVLASTIALLILAVLTPSWSIWLFIVQARELSSGGATSRITQSLQQIFEEGAQPDTSSKPSEPPEETRHPATVPAEVDLVQRVPSPVPDATRPVFRQASIYKKSSADAAYLRRIRRQHIRRASSK